MSILDDLNEISKTSTLNVVLSNQQALLDLNRSIYEGRVDMAVAAYFKAVDLYTEKYPQNSPKDAQAFGRFVMETIRA